MESEVSDSVKLAVMLVAVSALISIVWFTVSMGNNLKINSYNELSKIESGMKICQVASLNHKDPVVMPKAAVYNILAKESAAIKSVQYTDIDGKVSNIEYKNDCWQSTGEINCEYALLYEMVENDLRGKAEVYTEKVDAESYIMYIQDLK